MSTNDLDNNAKLEELIRRAAERLEGQDEETEEYSTTLNRYERLNKIKKSVILEPATVQEVTVDKDRVRFKDFIPVIGSLGGIAIIVVFEAFGHTLTSKATAFVSKTK